MKEFREPQYSILGKTEAQHGRIQLGVMRNHDWVDDPKRLVFNLSRYKFVAKMFDQFDKVLEIGCADGFASRLVAKQVSSLTAVDFDENFIVEARRGSLQDVKTDWRIHDIVQTPIPESFDGLYALDVLEHIDKHDEARFLANCVASLSPTGVAILGMPSIESQTYASPQSRAGHVNCKSGDDLRTLMRTYFHRVFLFSMNDEIVHTGFSKMAHYLLVLCAQPRSNQSPLSTVEGVEVVVHRDS
ncbi:MAG: class I SAM-dependent methyltransferase [Actinobacteria bacterium]|nr:class I SAM-dependent methyltransferase [Actinomycetota bacterium]